MPRLTICRQALSQCLHTCLAAPLVHAQGLHSRSLTTVSIMSITGMV